MESTYRMLASRAIERFTSLQVNATKPQRLLIVIAGTPGSGKTTIATNVAAVITRDHTHCGSPSVVVLGMDGYHLRRDVLDKLPNSREAYIRRGAPWTFDAEAVVALAERCKSGITETIYAPTFNHAEKDPVENGVVIPAGTGIVLFEGLYLLLDTEPWSRIADIADDCWYVNVDAGVAKERVAARHVMAGIEPNIESGRSRVEANDEINGNYIAKHSIRRDITVQSVDQ